jgi:hypothetical protein
MLDWRGYAGKRVLVGQVGSVFEARGFDLQRCYVLGTLEAGQDLPAAVKAILEDPEAEAPEASEVLWGLEIDEQGTAYQRFHVVIFDDQERLRYGHDFLVAVQQTGITTPAIVVRGVRLEEPPS